MSVAGLCGGYKIGLRIGLILHHDKSNLNSDVSEWLGSAAGDDYLLKTSCVPKLLTMQNCKCRAAR